MVSRLTQFGYAVRRVSARFPHASLAKSDCTAPYLAHNKSLTSSRPCCAALEAVLYSRREMGRDIQTPEKQPDGGNTQSG